ncbi:MAG: alpha/beta hydrolase [Anaerolineae bacterium]|nr:alpha/beta hydrolase [Anaerolineae bacterium]
MAINTAALATISAPTYKTATVTSKDGTSIGYRQFGQGPGIVLVQGTMGTAHNFLQLAELLAESFTVYTPDRRGRGLSSAVGEDYSTQKEIEDLEALLTKTESHHVFGLSSGAIISLEAARTLPMIRKLAIFEPPLFVNRSDLPLDGVRRYAQEMAEGKVAAALITAMQASQLGPQMFNFLPRWLMERFTKAMLAQEDKAGAGDYATMRALAPMVRYDFQVITENSGNLDRFAALNTEVLLLGGSKSPAYLKAALTALEQTLPHATRIELPGLDHSAAWNTDRRGQPAPVAEALRQFFA